MSLDPAGGLAHWQPDTTLPLPTQSIGDQLREHARLRGDRPALHWWDGAALQSLTYREMLAAAEGIAATLAARCQPGDRVAIWAGNSVEWVLVMHASALAGTVLAPFNTGWRDDEVAHALALTQPVLAFAGADHAGRSLAGRLEALAACPVIGMEQVPALARQPAPATLPHVTFDDPYLIQFTSGTTGRAKGALHSQRAMLIGGYLRPACEGVDENGVWLNAVPFHHIGGSSTIILGAFSLGASFVVLERFDRDLMLKLMALLPPVRTGGVPTMWYDILDAPDLPAGLKVQVISLGGASVSPDLLRRVRERFGAHCNIGYGQSEATILSATMPGDPEWAVCESIGRPLPHIEIRIADRDSGATLPLDAIGEIRVKGPTAMQGYYLNPEATSSTFDADGFLRTGDLGAMDADGFMRFHGRLREVIIRGGENVYPAEIENLLTAHPDVFRAAAVGVDDARLGQIVGAVVQLREGSSAVSADLAAFLAPQLARFKQPEHWLFVDAMPMTASGKIRKVELEALFSQELNR